MPRYTVDPNKFGGPIIPQWLLRRTEVSPGAKLLYAYLGSNVCAPDFPRFDISSGSQQRIIAKSIGASERSVRNWLKELEAVGLIRSEVAGWGKPSIYIFLAHAWQTSQ